MRVYVDAPPGLSRAMTRVSLALRAHAPAGVEVTRDRALADVVLLHTIGYPDTLEAAAALVARGQRYALAQYCLRTTQQPHTGMWRTLWAQADVVWSYYDLAALCEADGAPADPRWNLYMSPLGIDAAFADGPLPYSGRPIGVMTSGYVSSGQEAIWEVACAAERVGLTVKHLGPHTIGGMPRRPAGWSSALGIGDRELAMLYRMSKWVSGLRWCEGFEMPVIEGLACGARPIVFDRPEMRQWYGGHAVFVPELPGEELVDVLAGVLSRDPEPVSEAERQAALRRFAWVDIAGGFWQALAEKKEQVA